TTGKMGMLLSLATRSSRSTHGLVDSETMAIVASLDLIAASSAAWIGRPGSTSSGPVRMRYSPASAFRSAATTGASAAELDTKTTGVVRACFGSVPGG